MCLSEQRTFDITRMCEARISANLRDYLTCKDQGQMVLPWNVAHTVLSPETAPSLVPGETLAQSTKAAVISQRDRLV
jgi:hypothetical protein